MLRSSSSGHCRSIVCLLLLLTAALSICNSSKTPAQEKSCQTVDDLALWIRNSGGFVSPALVCSSFSIAQEQRIRGIGASRTIEKDELLLKIPSDPKLSMEYDAGLFFLGGYSHRMHRVHLSQFDLVDENAFSFDVVSGIARKIVKEMQLGSQSSIAPVIASMPSLTETWEQQIFFSSDALLSEFAFLPLAGDVARLKKLVQGTPECISNEISCQNFTQAFLYVRSRAFGRPGKTMIVPYAELLNTGLPHEINVKWTFKNQTDVFSMYATKRIPAGAQVVDPYWGADNAFTAWSNSLVLEHNPVASRFHASNYDCAIWKKNRIETEGTRSYQRYLFTTVANEACK